ncbi:MAG: hypothetical protein NE327_22175 [Lentisphaeraceae bacterium]|nr:hypothetical protein [Lentisphaeraceae bacterium]
MNCQICLRVTKLTKHHLIPVSRHKNKKIKAAFTKEQLKTTINLCRECHNQIHVLISEKEMAERYNTLDEMLNHVEIAKYTNWIRDKNPTSKIRVHRSRKRK